MKVEIKKMSGNSCCFCNQSVEFDGNNNKVVIITSEIGNTRICKKCLKEVTKQLVEQVM